MKTLSWLFPLPTTRGILFHYAMGAFYGGITAFGTVFQIIKRRKEFFQTIARPEPPKCLNDKKFGQHNFVQCKSVRLHYVSNGDPNKPLILFLHGFPEMWYSWKNQLPEFSKDYFTVALNMRGYGDSDKPEGADNYSLDKLVDDVRDVVHSLGKKKCIIACHDWGGLVGWTVAAQYPELVDKFIVCNAPDVKHWQQTIENDWKQFLMSWYVFFFNMPYLPELRFRSNDYKVFDILFKKYLTKEEIEGYKYYFSKPYGLSGPINYYRSLQRGHSKDFVNNLFNKRIVCPTLVIWGKNDLALAPSLAQDSCRTCDDFTIKMIDDCSHWTPLDKPELVNQYIREFLSKHN